MFACAGDTDGGDVWIRQQKKSLFNSLWVLGKCQMLVGGWKGREWTCPVVSGLHFLILASPLKPYIFLHPPQLRNLHCQVEKCLPPEAGGTRQVHWGERSWFRSRVVF